MSRHRLSTALGALAALALTSACERAYPPSPSPSPPALAEPVIPSAPGSAAAPSERIEMVPSAAAVAAPGPAPDPSLPPSIYDDPPGDEKTSAPRQGEWAAAKPVRIGRITDARCSVKRLREWVRVFCASSRFQGFSMLGGRREGVDVKVREEDPDPGLALVFPVRRGDARVIELTRWVKWGIEADVLVSEQWLEGDKGPLITVTGVP